MRHWAISSKLQGRRALRVAVGAALLAAAPVAPCFSKVFMTQEEALKLVFGDPNAAARQTAFLTDEQAREVERLAECKLSSRVVTYYAGKMKEGGDAFAYFDSHVVRTLPETVMVVVDAKETIARIDILSFSEPQDYLPKDRWMAQFTGQRLTDDLSLRRGIRPMTGATLSARAVVEASRRVLAIHRVVKPAVAPSAGPP